MSVEVKTVLLVDDEPANIQIVNSILKDTYKIRIATNGAKALELGEPGACAGPGPAGRDDAGDGWLRGLHAAERQWPTRAIFPVIFLTGQTQIDDETRGFEVGAVDYIHKPFSPAVVQARVRTHLVLRGIREQLASQLHEMQTGDGYGAADSAFDFAAASSFDRRAWILRRAIFR